MKIKICGMKYTENVNNVLEFEPDFLGFIFYPKSARFMGDDIDFNLLETFPEKVKKVAVFVNSKSDDITNIYFNLEFDYVQLHGDENPEFCKQLKQKGVQIIKAFRLDENFEFSQLEPYKPYCDYFLFDTKGEKYGGNGISFDWEILNKYDNEVPFFLSGGIGPENIEEALKIEGLNIIAFDLNSKLEKEPGLKDLKLVEEVKLKLLTVDSRQ